MKFLIGALLLAPAAALITPYEVIRADENLDAALESLLNGDGEVQPACDHPLDNSVKCISVPDDIEDTVFLIDPVAPNGLELKNLKGTPDYDLGLGLVQALRDATCDSVGYPTMAKYPWLHQLDFSQPVTATSLVKDYIDPSTGERIICASGAIVEEPVELAEDSAIIDLVGKQIHHTWDQNGGKFVSSFCDEETFTWNDLTVPGTLVTATENYVKTVISKDVVMYSWKESPERRDFGITWVFNFDTMIVYGVIVNVFPDVNLDLSGPFEIVDGLEVEEGLVACANA